MVDNYHGVILPNKEVAVMLALEEVMGEDIPLKNQFQTASVRYCLTTGRNAGHVGKLALARQVLEELPRIFGNLEYLTTLDLMENKLLELPVEFGNLHRLIRLESLV